MRTALLLLAITAGPAAAQAPFPATGSELFRGVLHRLGYKPAELDGPTPRVVIVFGPLVKFDVPPICQQVLAEGGSVLVATRASGLLPDCFPGEPPVTISTGRTTGGLQRIQPSFAVAEVRAAPSAARLGLTIPDGVVTPYANRWVESAPVRSPWVGTVVALGQTNRPFAVGGTGPPGRPGRALLMADEGVLTNRLLAGQLLDGADTGNLEFAVALARWLKPAGDGPTRCLFIERGQVVDRFDAVDYDQALIPPLPTPPPPSLSDLLRPEAQAKLTDAVNEAIDKVQSDDRLNTALTRGQRFGRTVRAVLGVLAVLTLVALFRRSRSARRQEPTSPAKAEVPNAGKAHGPITQRREELLQIGDHTAAVREYLIELFQHHGLPLDEYRHPRRMPRVEADPVTRRRLATLWEAAYGPRQITYTRWKELEPMIEAVRADGAAGQWRFSGGRA